MILKEDNFKTHINDGTLLEAQLVILICNKMLNCELNKIEKRFNLKPREKGNCFIKCKSYCSLVYGAKNVQKSFNLIENLICEKDCLDMGHCAKLDHA